VFPEAIAAGFIAIRTLFKAYYRGVSLIVFLDAFTANFVSMRSL
jgi:hypothetical protein